MTSYIYLLGVLLSGKQNKCGIVFVISVKDEEVKREKIIQGKYKMYYIIMTVKRCWFSIVLKQISQMLLQNLSNVFP